MSRGERLSNASEEEEGHEFTRLTCALNTEKNMKEKRRGRRREGQGLTGQTGRLGKLDSS